MSSNQDQLHNLWGWMQNLKCRARYSKVIKDFQDGDSKAWNKVWALLRAETCTSAESSQQNLYHPHFTYDARLGNLPKDTAGKGHKRKLRPESACIHRTEQVITHTHTELNWYYSKNMEAPKAPHKMRNLNDFMPFRTAKYLFAFH